ncbi:hypothetical protein VOLCADRAFT_121706 [Volvox carteri f. nagariensis]|uniref:Uncharacterized protein n=1 Tax=Volvox carteri f. nagariensis TaxID=3068 RepID=D8UI47_VOLCA|nr:uncharacterized protein VOLCADRAFT_121706 [Volvox carteri f. nagariensis]EFJ40631.1 hypothetical protein VOLCADRAFT_121706 [Volvox carteri f. nagariensis]|eukprot:XP_002958338.1 hypothetical protein VOLCADRAFT_121706 [Volvox carteri f. nagariensis]
MNANCPEISTSELYRLLAKLLASMHILDCLKDSKQALRLALSAVSAQEGDEQQLLTAVQDFFNMPSACLVLLRDMLLEQPEALAQTKVALSKLLEIQLLAVDGAGCQEGERNARIALSLLVHLYCCVDSVEQAQALAMQRLRACVATLRTTPIVPGYGDVSIDLLKPLRGLSQLGSPWESPAAVEAPALEERAVGILAGRAMQLMRDWQAAILQLDAFRTWQRRERLEEGVAAEAAPAEQPQAKANLPRCTFAPADMPDVVRMVSYIKGLHGVLTENMTWMEPLLRVHCAAHLAQLLNSIVLPVASGVLGMPQPAPIPTVVAAAVNNPQPRSTQLLPLAKVSCEAHPLSAPSSARGTGTCSVLAASTVPVSAAVSGAAGDVGDAGTGTAAGVAANIGRMWKNKALRHGRTRSTVSSLEAMTTGGPQGSGPMPPAAGQMDGLNLGPSQRTTEDSADTGNLIASITADGMDWAVARPAEFRNDPYARLREWFAAGGVNPNGGATMTSLNAPLQSVPEGQTPSSELHSPAPAGAAETQSRCAVVQESTEVGMMGATNTPSAHRGSGEQQWPGSSCARMAATTGTDGTEDGVECTVSSVSDCEGLMAGLDSEEACDSGTAMVDGVVAKETDKVQTHQQSEQQPWPAADLLWPAPPVPSASWLAGNTVSPPNANNIAVSAGGASSSAGVGKSPVAGGARVTAPAALSTNPLYIYPSAAREAVAEQERATVAIWIASEGGASAPPALATLEQRAMVTRITAEGTITEEATTPKLEQQRQQELHDFGDVRISYCDDLGATPQIDSGVRQHSCYEGSTARLGSRPQDGTINGYSDDLNLSQGQLDMPPHDFSDIGASYDGMTTAQMHLDTAAVAGHSHGAKKTASSPFKRIKKLFSKRFSATGEKTTSAPAGPTASVHYDETVIAPGASDPALEAYYSGADYSTAVAGFSALPAPYLAESREIASLDIDSSALLGVQGANYGAHGIGLTGHHPPTLSGEFLPGVMEEAAARDGAVAVLSVGPSGQVLGAQTEQQASGDTADTNAAGGRAGGKTRPSAGGGGGVGLVKGAAAFLEVAARAREEQSCLRLRVFASDMQGFVRLRNSAELMAEELARWLNQRRERGKSTKDGPSTMQLLALSSELRNFLAVGLPSLEPLLSFQANLAAAADLSALLLLDPSRSYGSVPGNGLAADARGSIPWELASKGVLMHTTIDSGTAKATELPLSSGLTVLTIFKDAIEALQMQQAQANASGYPEPSTAARLQLLYRRQAKWCLGAFMQMAARRVWATYKVQAARSKLGLVIPPGAPDVAASTVAFHGLFRPLREDTAPQQLLLLANAGLDTSVDTSFTLSDQLSCAIDDLVRQSASRTADLLLGSDLTSLLAVKQQGCGSSAAGITISAEDVVLTHACSVAALRTLSTWSYDMTAVRFRPTKHTKIIWDGLVGNTASEAVSPLFLDGADIALANIAVDSASGGVRQGGRGSDANTSIFGRAHVHALHGLLGLTGVGRWVAALRRHAVDLLADAAPLLRRVHELYDSSLAGPRGPSMRESGGASGYLQLQQRWLRDRGHSELLVSAHRALQALGNTVAAVALTDSVLAELCIGRAPHLLPLAASAMQADQQAHAALKAMATAGLMAVSQSAVQAASLVQERMQEQLPAAFGLPGWVYGYSEQIPRMVQVQLSCLTPEEQVVHSANVGDGVYVSAAALVQLAAAAAIAPGSVLHGDTMTQLQQAVTLEQLKSELAVAAAQSTHPAHSSVMVEKATLDQLKAWATRAESVRASWDRAVQLTVGAGTAASRMPGQRSAWPDSSASQATRALDTPALVSCSGEQWVYLVQHASSAGATMLARAAAAATASAPHSVAQQQQAVANSQGAPGSRGQAGSQGRPPSQPGMLNATMPPMSRNAPPRPPTNTTSQQPGSATAGNAALHRNSLNGPPLPPRGVVSGPIAHGGRSTSGQVIEGPVAHPPPPPQQQQQQQPLQQLRAASQVLMKSPRGDGTGLGTHGLFTIAGSTVAQSRSRAASSLGDWGQIE